VQDLIVPVLAHRLMLARDAVVDGRNADDVLREIAETVPVPAEAREDEPAAT